MSPLFLPRTRTNRRRRKTGRGSTLPAKHGTELHEALRGLPLLVVRCSGQHQRPELRQQCAPIRKDMELLSTTITVRPGSMLVFALGLLFAALKLT